MSNKPCQCQNTDFWEDDTPGNNNLQEEVSIIKVGVYFSATHVYCHYLIRMRVSID